MVAHLKGVPTSVAPEYLVDFGESGRDSFALYRPGASRAFSDLFVSVFQGVFSGGSRIISLVRSTDRDQLSALGHKHY